MKVNEEIWRLFIEANLFEANKLLYNIQCIRYIQYTTYNIIDNQNAYGNWQVHYKR